MYLRRKRGRWGDRQSRVAYTLLFYVHWVGLLTPILYGSKSQIITSESTGKNVFGLTLTSQAASSVGGMLELQKLPSSPPAQLTN